jgi:hypothetical protein
MGFPLEQIYRTLPAAAGDTKEHLSPASRPGSESGFEPINLAKRDQINQNEQSSPKDPCPEGGRRLNPRMHEDPVPMNKSHHKDEE